MGRRGGCMRLSTRITMLAVLGLCGVAMGQAGLASLSGLAKDQPSVLKDWKAWADSSSSRTFTLPDGSVLSRSVIVTTQAGVTTRTAATSGPGDEFTTSTDTWKREGNTVSHQGQTTRPDGTSVQRESTITLQDGIVVRTGSASGPNGRSAASTDTWKRADTGIIHDGSTSFSGGASLNRESTRRISLDSAPASATPTKVAVNDAGAMSPPALDRNPMTGGAAPAGGKVKEVKDSKSPKLHSGTPKSTSSNKKKSKG